MVFCVYINFIGMPHPAMLDRSLPIEIAIDPKGDYHVWQSVF